MGSERFAGFFSLLVLFSVILEAMAEQLDGGLLKTSPPPPLPDLSACHFESLPPAAKGRATALLDDFLTRQDTLGASRIDAMVNNLRELPDGIEFSQLLQAELA